MFGFLKRKPIASLTATEAHDLARKGEICLVDVREDGEWRSGHLPGAVHAPLSRLADLIPRLPQDRPVVFYCLSGKRSATAVEICRAAGAAHDRHIAGGVIAWRGAGLPMTR